MATKTEQAKPDRRDIILRNRGRMVYDLPIVEETDHPRFPGQKLKSVVEVLTLGDSADEDIPADERTNLTPSNELRITPEMWDRLGPYNQSTLNALVESGEVVRLEV